MDDDQSLDVILYRYKEAVQRYLIFQLGLEIQKYTFRLALFTKHCRFILKITMNPRQR
jgi:hypothetical protein